MLAISSTAPKSRTTPKCVPNMLPCRVHYDGPVKASKRYWDPKVENDGTQTAYFRGRKLRGREIVVPDGYRGRILNKTDRVLENNPSRRDVEPVDEVAAELEDEEPPEETLVMDEAGTFDSLTVWCHEVLPDEKDDPFSKGVGEWIKFAEAMHSFEDQPQAGTSVER